MHASITQFQWGWMGWWPVMCDDDDDDAYNWNDFNAPFLFHYQKKLIKYSNYAN